MKLLRARIARAALAAIAGSLLLVTAVAAPVLGASDRPDAPTITSPSNNALDLGGAALTVTGSGTPGDHIYVNEYATDSDYKAAVSRSNASYQQWLHGTFGGFGGPPGAAVGSSGTWSATVSASDISAVAQHGAFYLAAEQVSSTSGKGFYPLSPYSAAVKVLTVKPKPAATAATRSSAVRAGSAAAPSVFSDLADFHWRTFSPAHLAITAGMAIVLTLLLGFPTTLVNTALETSYDERSKRLKRISDAFRKRFAGLASFWKRTVGRWPAAVKTMLWFFLAAIISSFADPSFGFTLESLRILASLFAAFLLLNVLGAYVTWALTRRTAHTERPTFPARPSNLVVLIVSVLVARIIHLEPGLVFGGILGLDFGLKLAGAAKVRVTIVGSVYAAVISLGAWIGYSLMPANSPAWGVVALHEFLSSLAVAGLATLPISLLPLKALGGDVLFEWRKVGWAVAYAIGLLLFFFVLLPMPFSWSGVTEPLVAWVALFVAYSIVAILVWLAVRYSWFGKRSRAKPTATPEPTATK